MTTKITIVAAAVALVARVALNAPYHGRDKRDPPERRVEGNAPYQADSARPLADAEGGALRATPPINGELTAYSMVTHDGRRLVSRLEGTNTVFSLVATNALPAGLPPVREWTIYAVKATHTDIGLHNPQYIQRHGSVVRIDEARRLVAADPDDADPAAFRYVAEGAWFFGNYPADKGDAAARSLVSNEMARGRIDTGVTCAGNHTHLYGFEELCRSVYTKRELEDRWGIKTKTMIMSDNPGVSWSVVAPYADAGVENVLFSPNQWNPHPSTIWPCDKAQYGGDEAWRKWTYGWKWNCDAGGGGNLIDFRWKSGKPFVFWWESPDSRSRLLFWCGGQYERGGIPFGFKTSNAADHPTLETAEPMMARQLALMEARCPYDVWLVSDYGDDEMPTERMPSLFREWNAKWRWPEMHTVGRLDEPFDLLKERWGDAIPVVRGEMSSGWLQHAVCTPELLARKLAADRALPLAETKASIAALTTGVEYPAEDFRRAWDMLVWTDEHSYGTSGYEGRRVFETWMQKRDWIERAEAVSSKPSYHGRDKRNPPGRRVEGNAPYQDAAKPLADGVAENRFYRVEVANGVLLSVYDKELGREFLSAPAHEFRYTRDNHRTWEPAPAAALGAEMIQRVWLPGDEKKIVLETEFRHARDLFNTNRYDRFGYMAFPFDVPRGRFAAQLNGPVIDPVRDQSGYATDAYAAVRNWCAVENGDFGVALVQADSCLVEFGQIHPDKTCLGDPVESSGVFPWLFTDWLQMHNPDGDCFNPRFRFAITSYKGNWRDAHVPAFAARAVAAIDGLETPTDALKPHLSFDAPNVEVLTLKAAEDGRGWICRFRETDGRPARVEVRQSLVPDAAYSLCNVTERDGKPLDGFAFDLAPFGYATVRIAGGPGGAEAVSSKPPYQRRVEGNAPYQADSARPLADAASPYVYTGLIESPRAGHGERDGQMYVLWGVNAAPDWDHDELYRAEAPDFPCDAAHLVASVRQESPDGLAYRVMRYEDLGLKSHARYWYRIVPVFKDGRRGEPTAAFSGLTRLVLGADGAGASCERGGARLDVRFDGATATAWRPAALNGENAFFVPASSPWGREVHGGLPFCWPWFGKRDGCPKHGLARYLKWTPHGRGADGRLEFEAESTPETMKVCPHPFRLSVRFALSGPDSLDVEFTETNTGDAPFESAFGVHPYFAVADSCGVALDGRRLGKPWAIEEFVADGAVHWLEDLARGRGFGSEMPDAASWTAWNPGVERTPLCEGLDEDDWRRFYCLEPVSAHRALAPGESRSHKVRLSVRSNSTGRCR